jgi:hypothetical protein
VNADGFSDVIVGAWLYTAGQTNEGGAFVFHGSSSGLSANPNWDAEGDQALAYFGVSVAGAGDVNGDGFGDVIVGEQNRTNGQSSEGRAYVFFGSAEGLGDSLWIDESDLAGASFGHSVATAGDVNGDGYADVIVGAPSFANGQVTEGRVFVYQGSAFGPAIEPTWTAESNVIGAQFGISVATAGDVNGDGLSDVIAGAWTYANGNSGEGGAFVYHGAAAGLKTYAQWAAESDQVDALFGISVATAGDVNGDGFTDVIVGACGDDFPEVEVGRAYVYHGSASGLLTTAAWTVESDQDNARFGWSVSTAGDVNGDGFSDVIVGAPLYYNSQTFYSGRTYVYHGSASGLSTTAAWMVDGPAQLISFGAGVATAGDVNGDGFSDVVIGAPGYDNGEGDEGRAFVFHGSAAGLSTTAAWHAEPNTIAANFGCSVSTAGDVNGDGFSDVIVGAVGFSDLTEGQAFVYHGSTAGLLTTADWIAEASQLTGRFGSSVSTAGDVNGDGFSDVIVGAPEYDGGLQDEGRAFVYHGSALGLSTTAAWTGESDQTGATFGISAATAGDVNGDGFSDVIVGVDRYDNGQQDEGRALVYYGSESGLALAAAWAVESNHVFGYFGHSVTTAGDMNGDGFSDVIIGAHLYSNGQTHEGRAFAYYANDENGLDRIPRQARTDDSAPISLLGASNSESAFQLKVLGRTPAGRGHVRLQYEVKPFGTPFNGSGLVTTNAIDTGTPVLGIGSAVSLSDLASGLSSETLYQWRLRIISNSPFFPRSQWLAQSGNAATEADVRTAPTVTGVGEVLSGASESWLKPCAPNPFTTVTRLSYALPARGRVRLAIYDVSGRNVVTLADEIHEAGAYSREWDGHGSGGQRLPSGVYFARLEFGARVVAQKVVLTR